MQNLESFKQLLATPKKAVITTHHKPDADALGSSLALAAYLRQLGHQVTVISPSNYPRFLFWMKGNDQVICYDEGHQQESAELIQNADVIFCLDFSALGRINDMGPLVAASPAIKVLIDHHLQPEDFATYKLWDTGAAATCELIYDLIVMLGDEHRITKAIAECLYAGIMTDTGSFRHPNTTANVHRVIARLIELGADNSRVHKMVYDTNSEGRLRMLGYCLSEKLVVLPEFNVAYITLSKEELEFFKSETGDTEGFVNYALSIDGVVMAAIIVDRTEAIKISFRSVGDFSVNEFARKHFEGGGHKNAAGGKSDLTLPQTIEKFISLMPQYKNLLVLCHNAESHV